MESVKLRRGDLVSYNSTNYYYQPNGDKCFLYENKEDVGKLRKRSHLVLKQNVKLVSSNYKEPIQFPNTESSEKEKKITKRLNDWFDSSQKISWTLIAITISALIGSTIDTYMLKEWMFVCKNNSVTKKLEKWYEMNNLTPVKLKKNLRLKLLYLYDGTYDDWIIDWITFTSDDWVRSQKRYIRGQILRIHVLPGNHEFYKDFGSDSFSYSWLNLSQEIYPFFQSDGYISETNEEMTPTHISFNLDNNNPLPYIFSNTGPGKQSPLLIGLTVAFCSSMKELKQVFTWLVNSHCGFYTSLLLVFDSVNDKKCENIKIVRDLFFERYTNVVICNNKNKD